MGRWGALAGALALAGLAACEGQTKSPPAVLSTAPHVPCSDGKVISPGATHCGIGLSPNAVVTLDGLPLLGGAPFLLGEEGDSAAASLMIYPSPGGRFFLIRGCAAPALDREGCTRTAILDRSGGRLLPLAFHAEAGPSDFILWSPSADRLALIEPLAEGYQALVIVNPENGEAAAYPPERSGERFRINQAKLRWTSPTQVEAELEVCARACKNETRSFASP